MIDAGMVMACVLAHLQAQDRTLNDVADDELQKLIDEAIGDLRLAEDVVRVKEGQ
jgi:hypothetical protein